MSPVFEPYKDVFDLVPLLVQVLVDFDSPLSIAAAANAGLDPHPFEIVPSPVGVIAATCFTFRSY